MKTSIYAIRSLTALVLLSTLISQPSTSFAQGTAFNYQGRLNDAGAAANGPYDFQFRLFGSSNSGPILSATLTITNTPVSNGLFNVTLDFGAGPFNGQDVWLNVALRNGTYPPPPASPPPYITQVPRIRLAPTPYAIFAASASNALAAASVAANSITTAALQNGAITAAKILANNVVKTLNGQTENVTILGGSNVTVTTTDSNITIATTGGGGSGSNAWLLLGNAGTTSNNFLGTTDNQPVEVRVNNTRALRISPNASGGPNIIGGSPNNTINGPAIGVVIGGGSAVNYLGSASTNQVGGSFSTISGGANNNIHAAGNAVIGGGFNNTIQDFADSSAIGGGQNNTIAFDGFYGTIPGGLGNSATNYGFAAGRRAKANHTGAFVWADSSDADFISTANNEFLIRAGGGVGINTNNPGGYALNVLGPVCATSFNSTGSNIFAGVITANNPANKFSGMFSGDGSGLSNVWKTGGNAGTTTGGNYMGASDSAQVRLHATGGFLVDDPTPSVSFGATRRQMLNLYNADFGFGVQDFTLYSRGNGFAWYNGGVHSNNQNDPGGGGTRLMNLNGNGDLSGRGSVTVDNIDLNNGNNTPGLVFGANGSGEGIASKRTASGNQFGLDFYTSYTPRMSIANGGNVGIGTNNPQAKLHVNGAVIRVDGDHNQQAFIGGVSAGGEGVLIGSSAGNIHSVNLWNTANAKQMDLLAASITAHDIGVTGSYLEVFGGGNEQAYLGGDGIGNDVQVGSMNSSVSQVTLYNTVTGYMDLYAKNASVCALTIRGGCDLAEPFQMSHEDIPKGSLVIIDEANPGKLKLAEQAYDTRVAGIVSGANGVNSGITLHQEGVIEGGQNVALSGRVYALADAANGSIKPGDLLTSSATPGHVMRVADHGKAQGAIVGKAMSALKEGKGMVLVLVSLQ